MAIQHISELGSGGNSGNPAVTMTPTQTQARIQQMQQEVLNNASPVGRMTEQARMSGQITDQQANNIREYSQGYRATPEAPRSPSIVSTSDPARQDLSNIRATIDRLSQGINQQSQMNRQNAVMQAQQDLSTPPSSQDIVQGLLGRYENNAATDAFGTGTAGGRTPTGGAARDPYTEALRGTAGNTVDLQERAYDDWRTSMDQLRTGALPLNAEQQGQVDAINTATQRTIEAQKIANKNYVGGMTQLGIRSGTNMYSPDIAFGYIKQATDQGIAKLQDIETKAIESVSKLKQGFREENYKLINDQYDKLTGLLDKRQSTISDLLKNINDHEKDLRDYNMKAAEFEEKQRLSNWEQGQDVFKNMMDSEKFSWEQKQDNFQNMLASDKFSWDQKVENFNQQMASNKFSWQQKQDLIDNALRSDQISFGQKMDMLKHELDTGKFNYQQEKDIQDRIIELEKLSLTDNAIAREAWLAAGQPGSYFEFLQGAKAEGKAPTVDQATSGRYSLRMKESGQTIDTLEKEFTKMGLLGQYGNEYKPNFAKSSDIQRLETAQKEFLSGILRKDTGAAVTPEEMKLYGSLYFPVPGDKQKNIDDKRAARQRALEGMVMEAGPALGKDFLSSVKSGAKTYTSVGQILNDHPDKESEIENALRGGAPLNEVLKFYNSPTETTTRSFGKPLSTGEKGSNALTSLSEKFESSGNPGTIGYDTTGGWSYGAYQLAHNNAKKFADQSSYAKDFMGIPFNSEAFRAKWKEIAKRDPEQFKKEQEDYVQKTHLEPQGKKLLAQGVKMEELSPALQAVIFSTAVQHGANNNVITNAIKRVGTEDEKKLIQEIFQERWSGGRRFANSEPNVKKAVYNRFFGKNGELATALRQLNA